MDWTLDSIMDLILEFKGQRSRANYPGHCVVFHHRN